MGQSEGFLTRWSRRKRADVSEIEAALAEAVAASAAHGVHLADSATPPGPEPLAVNPAALPPVESITATSDIRAFLVPGVPAELTQEALRRAWGSDPEVRDFVEAAPSRPAAAAEPDPLAGTLETGEDVGRLVDRMVGEDGEAAAKPPGGKPA